MYDCSSTATFRIFVAQELGHYLVEVALDTMAGLR